MNLMMIKTIDVYFKKMLLLCLKDVGIKILDSDSMKIGDKES